MDEKRVIAPLDHWAMRKHNEERTGKAILFAFAILQFVIFITLIVDAIKSFDNTPVVESAYNWAAAGAVLWIGLMFLRCVFLQK